MPQLPDDPLALLPAQAVSVFSADLPGLRASPLFKRAQRFAEQHNCVDAERARWLLERTQRAVIARYVGPAGAAPTGAVPTGAVPDMHGVALFRGQYTAGDAREALTQAGAVTGTAAQPIVEEARGRFTVLHENGMAAVQLNEHLLALGTDDAVRALLAVADGTQPNWLAGGALMRDVDSEKWLGSHTLALITRIDAASERRLHRSLSSLGAGTITDGLVDSSAALALSLGNGASAEVRVLYPDAGAATRAGNQLRQLIDQASMLLRFTGIDLGLERTQITTNAAQLSVGLDLTAQQLDQLAAQLESMLEQQAPQCTAAVGDET